MFDLINLRRMDLQTHLLELHRLGQLTFWDDEDEQKHPRNSDGTFKKKDAPDKPAAAKPVARSGFKRPARHRAVDALRAANGGKRPSEDAIRAEMERIKQADLQEMEQDVPVVEPTIVPDKEPPKPKKLRNPNNYRYSNRDFTRGGQIAKWDANVEAIKVVKTLQAEKRLPTDEEKETLAKYTGWGQFPKMFDSNSTDFGKHYKRRQELIALIGDEDYKAARASTINSHFTSPKIVDAHWEMAKKLGFKGGRYLEPAVGSGYYLGMMPKDLSDKTAITAVEKDLTTGSISKALYPDANVNVQGFEETPVPDNFYDLVATNVPFGDIPMFDQKYHPHMPLIHDYYFMRSVDAAKPGGLIMHVTSTGTLDKLSPRVRRYLQDNAEFVSAVRLPEGTHKGAAATAVVTDLIVLRKKHPAIPEATDETPDEAQPKQGFTGVTRDSLGRLYYWRNGKRVPKPNIDDVAFVPDPAGGEDIPVNQYFANNPEQILGTLDRTGSMYAGNQKNVTMGEDFDERLQDAIERLPEGINWSDRSISGSAEEEEALEVKKDSEFLPGQLVEKDGKLYQFDQGGLRPYKVAKSAEAKLTAMIGVVEAARFTLQQQRLGEDAGTARTRLNELYDAFVEQYGPLSLPGNRKLYAKLPNYSFLLSLEEYNASTKEAEKTDIFRTDTVKTLETNQKTDNLLDASLISLNALGRIDLNEISKISGVEVDALKSQLTQDGIAFEDPSKGWVSRSEYLSGNVRLKLREAELAAITDESFKANVEALLENQPEDINVDEIGVKLGAPWIPNKYYEDFAADIAQTNRYFGNFKIHYSDVSGNWIVRSPSQMNYATRQMWTVEGQGSRQTKTFHDILQSALSGRPLIIRKTVGHGEDARQVVDKQKTEEAQEKVAELKERFQEWIWENESRRESIHRFYNDNFNNIVDRNFDGSHLTFPGMRSHWPDGTPMEPYQIQKDAVMRVVSTGRGLFGHEVGTGKTASMVASAMELRRLGLAKKPAIACLKSNIGQIAAEAQELYPDAKILSTEGMFDAKKRETTLNRIATGDYDIIVMSHEHLAKMQMKPEAQAKFIEDQLEELEQAHLKAAEIKDDKIKRNAVKKIEASKQKLEQRLKAALNPAKKDNVFFEDTGIDQIFVDEAHAFKNLPCVSASGNIKGVPDGQGSRRATDMLQKTMYLQEKHNGRGVVFATGTPISNSMVELFNMQRYLQMDMLKERNVHRFDQWKDTFGDTTNRFEFKLNGGIDATTRFAQFVNLPELRSLASEVIDIKRASDIPGIKRPNKDDQIITSSESPAIKTFMTDINDRATALAGAGRRSKGEDNMLSVCNDARAGSIDMRLVDPDAPDDPNSKTNKIVANVLRLYAQHDGETQALFSNTGIRPTKKTGFSLFADIKKKLVAGGIPADQIIDFSDPKMKGDLRKEAQARLKRGEARIALGSTETLGTGTNIQKNLRAIHHIDIPWRPSDLEQREGRGYRAGNKIKGDLGIYKYVQEGSADNLFWQIVGTKAHFINQFMLGKGNRTMSELDGEAVSAEEMISIATGDPDLVERLQLKDDVRRLTRSQRRHKSDQAAYRDQITQAPEQRKQIKDKIKNRKIDAEFARISQEKPFSFTFQNVRGMNVEQPPNATEDTPKAEVAKALQTVIDVKSLDVAREHKRYRTRHFIGNLNGFNVYLNKGGMLHVERTNLGSDEEMIKYESGPTLRSLLNTIKRIPKTVKDAEMELESFETGLEQLKAASNNPFRNAEKLETKKARLTQLENEAQMKGKKV